jgi:hypothetical protein
VADVDDVAEILSGAIVLLFQHGSLPSHFGPEKPVRL